MKVIFYDVAQLSDLPSSLRSASLADTSATTSGTLNITVAPETPGRSIDAIGIGNTDAATFTFDGETIVLNSTEKTGLYELTTPVDLGDPEDFYLLAEDGTPLLTETGENLLVETLTYSIAWSHDGSFLGRLAFGKSRDVRFAPDHEPAYFTTNETRITASGQVVPGAGGYTGRRLSAQFRYAFTAGVLADIREGYSTQLSRGFPLFVWFDNEVNLPFTRMYAGVNAEILLTSSLNVSDYSSNIEFIERF